MSRLYIVTLLAIHIPGNHLQLFSHGWLFWAQDCSPTGSSVHGILQARILEWVAIPFLQGIFLTQGSNPGLPHCRQTLYREPPAKTPRFISNEDVGYSKRKCLSRNPEINIKISEIFLHFHKNHTQVIKQVYPKWLLNANQAKKSAWHQK